MVRESIARHLVPEAGPTGTVRLPAFAPSASARPRRSSDETEWSGGGKADTTYEGAHASHLRLPLASGDEEGACLIEPAVRCNHCGYCLSLGH
jgi:hypothetical protein